DGETSGAVTDSVAGWRNKRAHEHTRGALGDRGDAVGIPHPLLGCGSVERADLVRLGVRVDGSFRLGNAFFVLYAPLHHVIEAVEIGSAVVADLNIDAGLRRVRGRGWRGSSRRSKPEENAGQDHRSHRTHPIVSGP